MTENILEFAVVGVIDGQESLHEPYRTVIGRCGDVSIRLGDRFNAIVQYDKPVTIADYERDPVEISRRPVDLVVKRIQAYERDREVLERGMTGSLLLIGEGLDGIEMRCSLAGVSTSVNANGSPPRHVAVSHGRRAVTE